MPKVQQAPTEGIYWLPAGATILQLLLTTSHLREPQINLILKSSHIFLFRILPACSGAIIPTTAGISG